MIVNQFKLIAIKANKRKRKSNSNTSKTKKLYRIFASHGKIKRIFLLLSCVSFLLPLTFNENWDKRKIKVFPNNCGKFVTISKKLRFSIRLVCRYTACVNINFTFYIIVAWCHRFFFLSSLEQTPHRKQKSNLLYVSAHCRK